LLSDRQLKRTIADLKAMERQEFGSRQRFAFYTYLAEVIGLYRLLRRQKIAKPSAGRIAKLFGIRTQKRTHSIRIIIDATSSTTDPKMRSRWTRALRYAWRERNRWKKLQEFMRLNGGPAGCAARWSALHVRILPNSVRIGGESRISKIPPVVGVEVLKPDQLFVRDGKVFRQPDVMETAATEPDLHKRC
jgi:hypothetical protein